jgi:hypothetical protein
VTHRFRASPGIGVLATVFALAPVACAGRGRTAPPAAAANPMDVARFLPLAEGTVLSYDTRSERTGTGIIVLQVRRPRPGVVELDDGGRVERLYVERDGLRYGTGEYWLKAPLQEGGCWAGRLGEVCIESVDATARVPAGDFTGCVTTVERVGSAADGAWRRTVFCPGVGMVLLEAEGWSNDARVQERAELRYAGPRIDLPKPPVD